MVQFFTRKYTIFNICNIYIYKYNGERKGISMVFIKVEWCIPVESCNHNIQIPFFNSVCWREGV